MSEYQGPVVFVDGVHYPAVAVKDDPNDTDENGNPALHADLSRPLRWVEGATYRDASEGGEPLHNDVHHQQLLVLDEAIRVGYVDPDAQPEGEEILLQTDAEAQAVRDLLQTMRGGQ